MLGPIRFEDLPGWCDHDHAAALDTFRRSAREILESGSGFARAVRFGGKRDCWIDLCRDSLMARDARSFFEHWFLPFRVKDPQRAEGLFTGYFEPEVLGSAVVKQDFQVPLYRKPADLVSMSTSPQAEGGPALGRIVEGTLQPYFTRRQIEEGVLSGRGLEIAWVGDWADAFFMQIQGSGRVRYEDGNVLRLTYDGKSGLPYTGIGGLLVERGVFSRDRMSMQAIRRWMLENPAEARELMWENESFVFFREAKLEDASLGALGAQHVQLTPRRSLAVDRSFWMFGTPVWLETAIPVPRDAGIQTFRQLMIAQDTGSAIKGLARGDVYWGSGDDASFTAGHMKSPGIMSVLLPIAVAEEMERAA